MQNKLKNFLLKLDLTENEISSIEEIAPMFEVVTLKEFVDDMMLLIEYGYPEEDITSLLLVNPNIFVLSAERLREKLDKIKEKNRDVEEALKKDPFLI